MNFQNIILVNSQFHVDKPFQGQIDNQISLNSQVAQVKDLKTTAQVKLDLTLKAHDGTEVFGTFQEIYFIPIEFEEDDITEQQVIGKATMRQMIPLLANDINYFLSKACLPIMPPTVLLKILKNQ